MSNDIKNWVKKQRVGDRNAKSLFLEIADCANDDGYCWHKIETFAETLEASTKSVERGLAYLVEKEFIQRVNRTRRGGKFDSKGTQILMSDNDWDEIQRAIEKRKGQKKKTAPPDKLTDGQPSDKLTQGEKPPSDKLTDGKSQKTDILSQKGQKPSDNLTDGSTNHQTICPSPSDNLTNRQFDALIISNKDLKPSLESSLSNGSDLSTQRESWESYLKEVQNGICLILDIPTLSSRWTPDIRKAFELNYTSAQFVQCFSNLKTPERIHPISPQNVIDALPFLAKETFVEIEDEPAKEDFEDFEYFDQTPETEINLNDFEKQFWKNFIGFCDEKLNKQIVDSWFRPMNLVEIDQTEKLIKVSLTKVNCDWISVYYSKLLNESLIAAGMDDYQFDWQIVKNFDF